MRTMAERATVRSTSTPSAPRIHLQPTPSHHTLLDGGWWPRTTDPVAELPGLILALDRLRGPVTHVMLGAAEWDSHPRRLGVANRVIRLGWFTSQPTGLLTATSNGKRVDLLVVPPATPAAAAATAMATAADPSNTVHTPHILHVINHQPPDTETAAENRWEAEGGCLRKTNSDDTLPTTPKPPAAVGDRLQHFNGCARPRPTPAVEDPQPRAPVTSVAAS